ncbi:MAG TPA: BadF/BadG/BcrA/BcrD ATPase family protein [Bryocella sp.]|nr:BadF/BadG/BcrA/BcrD ATPase family protein [Bryocella sp.]
MERQSTGTKSQKLVLIADAGATHVRTMLVGIDGRLLGVGRAGTGNPFAIGHVAACHNLKAAIVAALKDAHIPPARIALVVVGSAGVTHDGRGAKPIVEDIRKYLKDTKIVVVGDGRIALAGALAGAHGVVAVSGTGSIVLGKDPTGRVLRVGGWGPLAGDEGSAQWIGRRAIQEAAHAADSVADPSLLMNSLCRYFRLRNFDRIIDAIYAHPMTPSELGALAPLVTRAADRDDVVALGIFAEGAKALALQAVTAARRLHLRRPLVSHQGSMFTVSHFRSAFDRELRLQIRGALFVAPSLPPLGGAFLMALQHCGLPASPAVMDTFRDACHA